jgi:hypothetical protein
MKSHHYFPLINKELNITHIIDSFPEKHGKYINIFNKPVENVTADIINSSDAIIIFSSSYNSEIVCTLKEKYNFKKAVVFFEPEVKYAFLGNNENNNNL